MHIIHGFFPDHLPYWRITLKHWCPHPLLQHFSLDEQSSSELHSSAQTPARARGQVPGFLFGKQAFLVQTTAPLLHLQVLQSSLNDWPWRWFWPLCSQSPVISYILRVAWFCPKHKQALCLEAFLKCLQRRYLNQTHLFLGVRYYMNCILLYFET